MHYLPLIFTILIMDFFSIITPGPDFLLCVRNGLAHSRRIGVWTVIGMLGGIAMHIAYSLAGIGLIISQSVLLFNAMKYLGAFYLIWIGIKSYQAKADKIKLNLKTECDLSVSSALKMGFLTNALNPKATLFFVSLFSVVISPEIPTAVIVAIVIALLFNSLIWYSLVVFFMTHPKVKTVIEKGQSLFNKTVGTLLIGLGIKLAFIER